jgi:hypothetical protein
MLRSRSRLSSSYDRVINSQELYELKNTLFAGLMVGLSVATFTACGNPATETIQKEVDGGEKAINKARDVRETTDQTKSTLEQ